MDDPFGEKKADLQELPDWLQAIRQKSEVTDKAPTAKMRTSSESWMNKGESDKTISSELTGLKLWWLALRYPSPELFENAVKHLTVKKVDRWMYYAGFFGGFLQGTSIILMLWLLFSQSPLLNITVNDLLWTFLPFLVAGAIFTAAISWTFLRIVAGFFYILAILSGGEKEFKTITILIAIIFAPFYFIQLSLGAIPILGSSILILYLFRLIFPIRYILQVSQKINIIRAQIIVTVIISLMIFVHIAYIWSFLANWPPPFIQFILGAAELKKNLWGLR